MKQLIWLVLLLSVGCQVNQNERVIQTAFYYWKQQFRVGEVEQNYLNNLKTKTIYIRFFDINKNDDIQQTKVLARIRFVSPSPKGVLITPTVYITNNTLKSFEYERLSELADLIWNTRQEIIARNNLANVKGMQIDCDWSLSTRDQYFQLLKLLKPKLRGEELSATIRLHQVKFYQKTGIPPVDRGTLMFYNMDDVTDATTQNSILDLEVAKQYFVNFDQYDLPLDVALPLFRWGVVRRRGRVVQLINHLDENDLLDRKRFEKEENAAIFKVLESHYLKGFYVYQGDEIRLEAPSKIDITASVKLLNQHIRSSDTLSIIYYHLDSASLSHYAIKDLVKWGEAFK
jgi:hypothetical protein